MRRPAIVLAMVGLTLFAGAFVIGRTNRSVASAPRPAATATPAATPGVIAAAAAKPLVGSVEPARLPDLRPRRTPKRPQPTTPGPPSSTPQPPVYTPQPPVSTPRPPVSTPRPPVSTPKPPPGGCDPC
jgi:hypothetical protein